MVLLDAAMFYTMLAMGFAFMFLNPPDRNKVYAFRLLSTLLFFIVAIILNAQASIVFQEDIVNPSNQTYHSTSYILHNNTTFLGWIFVIIALTNAIMVILQIAHRGTQEAQGKADT